MTDERYSMVDGKIFDGEVEVTDVVKELNQLEYFRKHHKNERRKMERKNRLLIDVVCGVKAYIKLVHMKYDDI